MRRCYNAFAGDVDATGGFDDVGGGADEHEPGYQDMDYQDMDWEPASDCAADSALADDGACSDSAVETAALLHANGRETSLLGQGSDNLLYTGFRGRSCWLRASQRESSEQLWGRVLPVA